MAILSASNIKKTYSDRTLFEGVSFEIGNKDIIGLVGANGAGKTTLFKILTGETEPDAGGTSRVSGLTVGYLSQHACEDSMNTAFSETLEVFRPLIDLDRKLSGIREALLTDHSDELIESYAALSEKFERDGGLIYTARTKSALKGLGFSDSEVELPVSALSGGQKSKIGLCRLLLSSPMLLLLDEPTNHLDIDSVEWLEDYIKSYSGAVVIISHDRYFLDSVTNRTFEMEHGRLDYADGNYTRYLELKEERREAMTRQYDNTVKEIKRVEAIIEQQKRFGRERNFITAASKQKQVDRLAATLEKPDRELTGFKFKFEVNKTGGNDVLSVDRLSMSFPGKTLYENASLLLKRGQRIFLIGSNGCGKTTLLKQILAYYNKERSPYDQVRFGSLVTAGYFDQTGETLDPLKSAIDEIWDAYPQLTETAVRNALAAFLFKGDDVYKKVSDLSGGERARVAICKLMLSGCNLLLLDEPTNHLDLYSREALESALKDYPGSLLVISHDRYFINKLADKICLLSVSGIDSYDGNYDRYLSKKPAGGAAEPVKKQMGEGGKQYKQKKQRDAELRRIKTLVSKAELEIEEAESELDSLHKELDKPEISADYEKTIELSGKIGALSDQLERLMTEWEAANDALEELSIEEREE